MLGSLGAASILAAFAPAHRASAAPSLAAVIADIALSKPFGTRSPWRLVATQDPSQSDPNAYMDGNVPGTIHLCLTKSDAAACDSGLKAMPTPPAPLTASDWEPHTLDVAQVVSTGGPRPRPLLLLRTASLHSGDGDQAIFTQLLAYRPGADRFTGVYAHVTGRNNSQEVRFIASGPIAGNIVSAEPTRDAPFGFWIEVDRPARDGDYGTILKYRSATRYGDGNPLAVIDSEMPSIGARLGFWRPGLPLPLPAGPCPKPRLVRSELWCQ